MSRTFRELEVHARPIVSEDELHAEDRDVPRVTRVAVNAVFLDGHAAGIAKDVFSRRVPVKELEDFEMKVVDPETGQELDEAPEYEALSGLRHGHLIDPNDARDDLATALGTPKTAFAEPGPG